MFEPPKQFPNSRGLSFMRPSIDGPKTGEIKGPVLLSLPQAVPPISHLSPAG